MRSLSLCALAFGIAIGGCGDDDTPTLDAGTDAVAMADATISADAANLPDAATPVPGAFEDLVKGEWTLSPGQEGYVCVYKTITETMWANGFEAIAPLGTHHTVLTIDDGARDEISPCQATTNGPNMIYGSGVGTERLDLPEGVALKLEAGTHLVLNLHLFNTDAQSDLSGLSGVRVRTIPESEVVDEAEVFLAGSVSINIPARANDFEVRGFCSVTGDTKVFAIAPHMHQLGTKMKVSHNQTTILNQGNYSFDEQTYTMMEPFVQMQDGDRINVDCTYDNPTDSTVTFGDSSLQEMCFATIYRFPKIDFNRVPIPGAGPVCIL